MTIRSVVAADTSPLPAGCPGSVSSSGPGTFPAIRESIDIDAIFIRTCSTQSRVDQSLMLLRMSPAPMSPGCDLIILKTEYTY